MITSPWACRRLHCRAHGRGRSGGKRWRATVSRAPWGAPTSLAAHFPSSMTPALTHFWMSRRTLLSAMRCSTNLCQPGVIKTGEEIADVGVEHPVHLLPLDPDRESIQRIMRAAPRSEPVGEAEEVLLVDGVEHLDDGPLDDLVLQRGNAERPQPPVSLRDVRPARWTCPVRAAVDPSVQVLEFPLQAGP